MLMVIVFRDIGVTYRSISASLGPLDLLVKLRVLTYHVQHRVRSKPIRTTGHDFDDRHDFRWEAKVSRQADAVMQIKRELPAFQPYRAA